MSNRIYIWNSYPIEEEKAIPTNICMYNVTDKFVNYICTDRRQKCIFMPNIFYLRRVLSKYIKNENYMLDHKSGHSNSRFLRKPANNR